MSVLVKNMKMPESCGECRMTTDACFCSAMPKEFCGYADYDEKRPEWCPLVELPEKHGRLIDADELIDDLRHDVAIDQDMLDYEELSELNRIHTQGDKDIKQNAIDLLEHSKTVIEAEGEG